MFKSLLAAIQKDCGAVLTRTYGSFRPPDEDSDGLYDSYLDCLWIIPSQENQTIVLKVNQIDIESAAFCSFDYLKVSKYLVFCSQPKTKC